ncbi:MAG: 5'-3' exonuclease H3TH domain-containing protein [Pseudomonadales bacterium]|nr:5'-3' exonuclease H3TH domain-containing protein [Pseudomonadales bacterium]
MVKALLIDGHNLLRRIYEASPERRHSTPASATEVLTSCVRSLQRALLTHKPSHCVVVFDSHDETWRHRLYGQYKQGRSETPEMLLTGLVEFERAFLEIGVKSFTFAGYEADDVIATMADRVGKSGSQVIILSSDKGFLQLLDEHVRVFNHFEQREYDADFVRQKFEVSINQLTSYWAMAGDSSNNIKGVPKIGKKTAVLLLQQYASLQNILNDAQASGPAAKVQAHEALVCLCQSLVTLKTDIALDINLKTFRLDRA